MNSEMDEMFSGAGVIFSTLANLFIFILGLFLLFIVILYIRDSLQTKDAVLKNYPVIGHFRYVFSALGEFFRQYFFAMDREEMPFNRAEREWIYRSFKGAGNTIAFGSTQNLNLPSTPIFVNSAFPILEKDIEPVSPVIIGQDYCEQPYEAKSILNISAMSYGAISKPAVKALSAGAKKAGCWLNTGEGGLSPYHLEGGADIVFQIGTAKYGVRNTDGSFDKTTLKKIADNSQVKMFEIKMSQGAKPGKGGILPGAKVTESIAKIRGIPMGEDSISPNRHPEINNVSDLLNMINKIRDITGKPVGFKSVVSSTDWLDEMCDEIKRRGIESAPDFITVDGGDGGTGAAPMALMDNVGLPIKESLPIVIDLLTKHDLRDRIKVIASGKLVGPAKVAWALCAGADLVNSARGFMFALGCIQSLKCHKNTCPTGITTHDKRLQKGLNPKSKAVRVEQYVRNLVYSVEIIAHSCGVSEPRKLNRDHVRIVQKGGSSILMRELYAGDKK